MKMKCGCRTSILCLILLLTLLTQSPPSTGIGINLGTQANNFPSPADIVNFCKKCTIEKIRLFEPVPAILDALRNSGLGVSIGVLDQDLQNLGDPQAATDWVNTNIIPYSKEVNFQYITLGNEVIPGPLSQYVPQAITNIYNAIASLGLADNIKVTTVVSMTALATSYPPSAGSFTSETFPIMSQLIPILNKIGAPIMINAYPYFAYVSNPQDISLEYATFRSESPVVVDGQYEYYNLFDAMVDAFDAAVETVSGAGNVSIAVSETGWPTAGNEPYSSIQNAREYIIRLFWHVKNNGTPRRPDFRIDTFIFEMFNENMKTPGVEQNFGAFYPNMTQVYSFYPCGAS